MASRGFEFAFDLNGASTPMIKDFTVGAASTYAVGDLVCIQSDGYVDLLTTSIGEVTGVVMEGIASTAAVASSSEIKVAIATPSQVWKCSMDSSSCTAIVGYCKTLDTNNAHQIDAGDKTNGSLILFDKSKTDDEGNVLGYVMFHDVTFVRGTVDTDTT
jgi:hypothetical protein